MQKKTIEKKNHEKKNLWKKKHLLKGKAYEKN